MMAHIDGMHWGSLISSIFTTFGLEVFGKAVVGFAVCTQLPATCRERMKLQATAVPCQSADHQNADLSCSRTAMNEKKTFDARYFDEYC